MMIGCLSTRRFMVWGLLGLIIILAMGCSHRTSHGSSLHGKKFEKGRSDGRQADLSELRIRIEAELGQAILLGIETQLADG